MARLRTAITLTSTGELLRWDAGGAIPFDAGTETSHAMLAPVSPQLVDGELKRHHKVVAGAVVLMDAAEKAVVDTATDTKEQAAATGATVLGRTVQGPGALPVPPPRPGLLVAVRNIGGSPGLALSTQTGWVLFASTGAVP